MNVDEPVWSVAFGHVGDSVFLAGACAEGQVKLWDVETGELARGPLAGHTGAVLSVAVGRVGERDLIASCGVDGTVRIWDPDEGQQLRVLRGHVGGVRDVAFGVSYGKTLLASAGADGTVRMWDPETGATIHDPFRGHAGSVLSLAFASRRGRTVLCSGSDDLTIRLWDVESGVSVTEPLRGHQGSVRAIAASQLSSGVLASASDDGTVRVWDIEIGAEAIRPLIGHTGTVRAVEFVQLGGSEILVSGGIDGLIRVWDPSEGGDLADLATTSGVTDLRDMTFGSVRGSQWMVAASGSGCIASRVDDQFDPQDVVRASLSRAALVSADDTSGSDLFGRRVLARHLIGVIAQLTDRAGEGADSVVVSVDGRWGSGKSTVARVLIDELSAGSGPATKVRKRESRRVRRSQHATQNSDALRSSTSPDEHRPEFAEPITIWFDAWRESAVAPHWWALAAAIRKGIRAELGPIAKLMMAFTGGVKGTAAASVSGCGVACSGGLKGRF